MSDPNAKPKIDKSELLVFEDPPKKVTKGPPARFAQKMAAKKEDVKGEKEGNDGDVLVVAPAKKVAPKKSPAKKEEKADVDQMEIDE